MSNGCPTRVSSKRRQRRVLQRLAFRDDGDRHDRTSKQTIEVRGGLCRRATDEGDRHRREDADAATEPRHQKTCLTRTSSAKVRSSFCDTIHASRSVWLYSMRMIWSCDEALSDREYVR